MADILIIDDEEAVRHALARVLEAAGHTVREAPGGREGLRLAQKQPPDVVISDVHMPEMDGLELLIRVHREFPDVRIIIMTGGGVLTITELRDIAAKLGARVTLSKPVSSADLRSAIDQALA